jgi:hypothetical protein
MANTVPSASIAGATWRHAATAAGMVALLADAVGTVPVLEISPSISG